MPISLGRASRYLRLQICIWVMVKRAFRKPLPERPQFLPHAVLEELWQLLGLLFEVATELAIGIQEETDLGVILYLADPAD